MSTAMAMVAATTLIATSACSAWHVKYPGELAPDPGERPNRGYVVTQFEAYELDVEARDTRWLHGKVRRHWNVGWDERLDRAESPDATADRLGWPSEPTQDGQTGQTISIPLDTVRHARLYETDDRLVAGWVLGSVGVLTLAFVGLIAAGASSGMHGRPIRVRGKQQFAAPIRSREWSEDVHVSPIADDATRFTLAAIWIFDAQAEHSSIAAFSKLSLDLIALGAPPSLVQRTHRAALEEIEHARLCFALASAYRGAPVGPGPLPAAATGEPATLERLARETLLDGCINETVAAEAARLGTLTALDPAVRDVLAIQAADEATHAALAWDIVDWCLREGGEPLRHELLAALASAPLPAHAPHLPSHGRLGGDVYRKLALDAIASARARLEANALTFALSA